jgi:ankyrin repeat protein
MAVWAGHTETAHLLLDRGCPLDVAEAANGDTVLHLAARKHDNILAVLLRKGANPDIKNKVTRLGHLKIMIFDLTKCSDLNN